MKEIIAVAKKLSEDLSYCRVDLYAIEEKIYFGEMTYTPRGGHFDFYPTDWDRVLGEKCGWPEEDFDPYRDEGGV